MVLLDTPFGGYHGPDLLMVRVGHATSSARRFLLSVDRAIQFYYLRRQMRFGVGSRSIEAER